MRKTFDDIIRRRWEEQQFPIHEDHRANMIELLEGKRKRKAFAFWWWGAGAVVLVAAYFILQTLPGTEENAPTRSSASTIAAKETVAQANHAATASNAEKQNNTDEKNAIPGTLKDAAENHAVESNAARSSGTSNVQGSTVHKNTAIQNSTANNKKPISKSSQSGNVKASDPNKDFSLNTTTNSSAHQSTSTPLTKTTDQVAAVSGTTALQSKTPTATISTDGENNVAVNLSETNKADKPGATENGIAAPVISDIVSADEAKVKDVSSVASTDMTAVPQRSLVEIAWLDALPLESLPIKDYSRVGTIVPNTKIEHPLYAFAEAGIGMVLPSKNEYKSGLKLNAGAGVGLLVSPKLHVMLSGGYLVQEGGFDFQRTSTVQSFGFGARSQVNSLDPERLHYVYTKLGLVYRMKRHSIGASAGLQWLYGAQGDITTYTTGEFETPSQSTRSAWLSINGLNRYHWNASLQYGYRLTPRINLAAGTQYFFNSLITADPELQKGFDWDGITAKVQPFFTINYLLYGPF